MHARSRSQNPILVGGLEEITKKKKNKKEVVVGYQPCEGTMKGSNEEEIRSSPLGCPKTKDQHDRAKGSPQL